MDLRLISGDQGSGHIGSYCAGSKKQRHCQQSLVAAALQDIVHKIFFKIRCQYRQKQIYKIKNIKKEYGAS